MATIVKNIISDNCNCKNPDVKIEGDCQPPIVDVGSEDAFNDYNYLINKPSINGNVLAGDKTGEDLGLVDAEEGKGLSTNDFTDDYKNKLDHIEPEAQRNVQTDWDQQDDTADDFLKNKPTKVSTWENDADYDTQAGVRAKIAVHNVSDDAHLDIRQSVVNERNRATYAENEIAALINGETAERQAADTRLQQNINTERDTRILGDTILQDNIDTEAEYRRDADTRLQTNINSEATTRAAADNQLQANINNEISNRTSADSVLQDQIDTFNSRLVTERNERQQADTTLQTNINNERIRAEAAEGVLDDKIDQEIVDRTTAVAGFQAQLNAEIETRAARDNALAADIEAEETRATGVEGSLTNLSTTSKTNLVSAINEVNSNVTAERQRAEGAESALGTRITNETTAREIADTELGNRITGETNRATGVEGTLSNLTTTAKTNLVAAINEVDSHADTANSNIGTMNSLTTDAKTTLVAAINEVDSHTDTNTSNIGTLSNLTTDAKTNLVAAINEIDSHADTNASNISDIQDLIPAEADPTTNQLADKDFVNSSIASQTGNFIGTFANIPERDAYTGTVTNNDYCYVINSVITNNGNDWASFSALDAYNKDLVTNFDYAWVIDGSKFDLYRFDVVNQTWDKKAEDVTKEEITLNNAYNRYKAIVTTSPASLTWEYEYTLNNSSFTASQWAAINSGATTTKINQITTNQNAIGTLNSLTTDAKTNLVSAINEVDSHTDTNTNNIGTMTSLTTNEKTTLVGAINELNSNKVEANTAITGATHTKITYDSKGLVTAGADITLSDVTDITASASEVNVLDGITASTSELNILDGVTASTAELNILDGVTADANELNILDGATLTTTELNYVDGVTSSIQTQLNNKQPSITGAATTITDNDLTTNKALISNASGKVAVSSVTDTELGYVSGVTSSIQTQLNNKEATITGAATTITSSNLTVNKALISNASGKVAVSSVSSTELGYLSGVTSAIQTQINAKANDADISAVGKSNDYEDLDNKPTIGNATITFKANGTTISGQSFTTNATTDVEIDLGNTGLVDDVKINNTSIVTNKIANVPVAANGGTWGVVKVNSNKGITESSGQIEIIKASDAEITAKTNNYRPIVPSSIEKAVMEGLGNYGGTAWTDAYKYTARDTIGATQVILKDWD